MYLGDEIKIKVHVKKISEQGFCFRLPFSKALERWK